MWRGHIFEVILGCVWIYSVSWVNRSDHVMITHLIKDDEQNAAKKFYKLHIHFISYKAKRTQWHAQYRNVYVYIIWCVHCIVLSLFISPVLHEFSSSDLQKHSVCIPKATVSYLGWFRILNFFLPALVFDWVLHRNCVFSPQQKNHLWMNKAYLKVY